jgi:hypothetical protein
MRILAGHRHAVEIDGVWAIEAGAVFEHAGEVVETFPGHTLGRGVDFPAETSRVFARDDDHPRGHLVTRVVRPARRTVRLPHGALVPVGVVLRVAGL